MAARLAAPYILVVEHAMRRAFEIVELATLHRPDKRCKPEQPEPQRQRHEEDENVHAALPDRRALSVTRIDEPDIASAAISGVTNPAIATGTATAL